MKKLLEYLKEYQSSSFVYRDDTREWWFDKKAQTIHYRELTSLTMVWACFEHRWLPYMTSVSIIISRRYWFIEWLVKNQKIEWYKYCEIHTKTANYTDYDLSYDTPDEVYVDTLLMELSIQEEPIKFLSKIIR